MADYLRNRLTMTIAFGYAKTYVSRMYLVSAWAGLGESLGPVLLRRLAFGGTERLRAPGIINACFAMATGQAHKAHARYRLK